MYLGVRGPRKMSRLADNVTTDECELAVEGRRGGKMEGEAVAVSL